MKRIIRFRSEHKIKNITQCISFSTQSITVKLITIRCYFSLRFVHGLQFPSGSRDPKRHEYTDTTLDSTYKINLIAKHKHWNIHQRLTTLWMRIHRGGQRLVLVRYVRQSMERIRCHVEHNYEQIRRKSLNHFLKIDVVGRYNSSRINLK